MLANKEPDRAVWRSSPQNMVFL